MTTKRLPNSVSEFTNARGDVIRPGTKVRVRSRHGSTGTGTVVDVLVWLNAPDTMVLQMDPDTVYSSRIDPGWISDEERFKTTGVFGGEIKEIITLN